jgi:hypothetical protein
MASAGSWRFDFRHAVEIALGRSGPQALTVKFAAEHGRPTVPQEREGEGRREFTKQSAGAITV